MSRIFATEWARVCYTDHNNRKEPTAMGRYQHPIAQAGAVPPTRRESPHRRTYYTLFTSAAQGEVSRYLVVSSRASCRYEACAALFSLNTTRSGNFTRFSQIAEETGTVIQFRCSASMFKTLKPKNKRVEPTFEEYVVELDREHDGVEASAARSSPARSTQSSAVWARRPARY